MNRAVPTRFYETVLPEKYQSRDTELAVGAKPFVDVLQAIHNILDPKLYLEIGVWYGRSLALANCPSIAIDPDPQLKVAISPTTRIFKTTSDAFFKDEAESVLVKQPDLALIDGMHLFEFALRDFMNVERSCHAGSLILFDDIFPNHPLQAKRKRVTGSWTGDVWKIVPCLQEYRPDLILMGLDSNPTGLLAVAHLNNNSTVLSEHYDGIIEKFQMNDDSGLPPPSVLDRVGALAPDNICVQSLLALLRVNRNRGLIVLQQILEEWSKANPLPMLGHTPEA